MIQSTLNNVVVKIKSKYIRNFSSILRMAAIQNLSSVDPSDYVNIVGEVVSSPLEISTWRREYRGYKKDDICVGDTAIFSHDVIYNFVQEEPDAEPIYKNSFWYKNDEYWNCDIMNLYAVIRKGEIRMQNDYVMVENMEKQSKIYLPQHLKKKNNVGCATVTHIQTNPLIKIGDRVYFNPSILRIYQMNEKPFGILKKDQILGKEYRPVRDWPVNGKM